MAFHGPGRSTLTILTTEVLKDLLVHLLDFAQIAGRHRLKLRGRRRLADAGLDPSQVTNPLECGVQFVIVLDHFVQAGLMDADGQFAFRV